MRTPELLHERVQEQESTGKELNELKDDLLRTREQEPKAVIKATTLAATLAPAPLSQEELQNLSEEERHARDAQLKHLAEETLQNA